MKKLIISLLVLIIAALGGSQVTKLGGTPGNLPATLATTSTVAVGQASVVVLFPPAPSNRICAGRVISTIDPLYIGFNNTATATLQNSNGSIVQSASSTAQYPAEQYGCDAWIVKSAGTASTSVYIAEFKQ